VPKQALIYEGSQVRVWVAHEDKSIELRQIKPGLTNGDLVEVEVIETRRADVPRAACHRPRCIRQLT